MSNELDKIIGARLKFYRLANELSQTKLGRQVGVTFQQIQKYENGANRITVSRLIDFSRVLNFSMAEFFHGIVGDDNTASDLPKEIVEALAMPQAMELNRHFSEIDNPRLRRQLVSFLKALNTSQVN